MSSHHRDVEERAKTKDAQAVRVDADELISRPRIAALDVLVWNPQPFLSRAWSLRQQDECLQTSTRPV